MGNEEEPWVDTLLTGWADGSVKGLWVHGPRQSGSSTSVRNFTTSDRGRELFSTMYNMKKRASSIERLVRDQWRLDGLLKANANDYPLWQDSVLVEEKLNEIWNADALWIDDLYTEIDVDFVCRNMLMNIDSRVKSTVPQITLVSGACAPDRFGDWDRFISNQFVVVDLRQR